MKLVQEPTLAYGLADAPKVPELGSIPLPVRIAETDPLDVPQSLSEMDELVEAIRADEFEGRGART